MIFAKLLTCMKKILTPYRRFFSFVSLAYQEDNIKFLGFYIQHLNFFLKVLYLYVPI